MNDRIVVNFHGTGLSERGYHAFRRTLRRRCERSRRVRYIVPPFEALNSGRSNWSRRPIGTPGWVSYQVVSRHRTEGEMSTLIELEELASEVVGGHRPLDEAVEMGVRLLVHGMRRVSEDEGLIRSSVIALFEQELRCPCGGYYYCGGGVIHFQADSIYWDEDSGGMESEDWIRRYGNED